MARQIIWLGAILSLALLTAFYAFSAIRKGLFLASLDGTTEAVVKEWHVKEGAEGYFYPYAYFVYTVDGQTREGASFYQIKYARNPYALAPVLQDLSERSMVAYYNTKTPSLVTLEKAYPYKEALKALAVAAICCYFLMLKRRQGALFTKRVL